MGPKCDLVRRFIAEVQIGGDRALCEDLVAPDFINHQIRQGQDRPDNREAFCKGFEDMAQTFAPLQVDIHHMTEDGDKVWTHKTVTGRHRTSNEILSFTVIDILRLKDGQIAEHWAVAVRNSEPGST